MADRVMSERQMGNRYDLIIIGAGPAGYTAALKAAGFGMKVAVIEKERLGGVGLNTGCIPAKALLYASSFYGELRQAGKFGIRVEHAEFDFGKMQDYKDQSVNEYRERIERLFTGGNITFINGIAKLHKDNVVEVETETDTRYYNSTYVLLAAGAEPIIPDIPGIDLPQVLTSREILEEREWKFDRLLIIGGGVIGVEIAAIFAALGSKVTLVEKSSRLLNPMDPEISECLEENLRQKKIDVRCNASVMEIRAREDGRVSCVLHEDGTWKEESADRILVAVGRMPDMGKLLAEDAEVELKDGRAILKSNYMTTQKNVYAVGDMIAKMRLSHVAAAQATYVIEDLAGKGHRMQLSVVPNGMFVVLPVVPSCIYTSPEIASVGFTEEDAHKYNMKVKCGQAFMRDNGRAILTGERNGFIRLIFEAYSSTLVGAQIMCPRATDMIGEMATAIANGLTAYQLSTAMRAHPTYGETIAMAIEDALKTEL